jgi:GR25 family glycosyltransferase involved in LPS biosynthesis
MNYNELFPLNLIINLDSRPDRLKISLENEIPKIGLKSIGRVPGQIYHVSDNNWINGAIGCLSSHVMALRYALETKQNITVFEDDIKLANNSEEIMNAACEELSLSNNWSMIYWGGNILKPFYQITDHLAKLTHCQSTVCYSVNYPFIEKLLSYIPTNTFISPIDVIYSDRVIPENNCYISIPMIATQRKDKSDIEGVVVDYESYLWKRYNDNLIKL